MDIYNQILDLKDFIRKNKIILIILNVILLLTTIIAIISGFNSDFALIKERGNLPIIAFITEGNLWYVWGFFILSIILVGVLILSKINRILSYFSYIFVLLNLYFGTKSCIIAMVCCGVGTILPCLIIIILQIVSCIILQFFYVYNVRSCGCGSFDWCIRNDNYQLVVLITFFILFALDVLIAISCILLNLLT